MQIWFVLQYAIAPLFVGIFFIIIAKVFSPLSKMRGFDEADYELVEVEIIGIKASETINNLTSNESHTYYTTVYSPQYQYTYNGQTYTATDSRGTGRKSDIHIGEKKQIYVLKANPSIVAATLSNTGNEIIKKILKLFRWLGIVMIIVAITIALTGFVFGRHHKDISVLYGSYTHCWERTEELTQ